MVFGFAVIGSVVALIPGASFLLIPMEVYLLYRIITKYDAFDLYSFIGISGGLVAISGFLKGLAWFLHAVPVFGQFANSAVAFVFIMALGSVAKHHFARRAQSSKAPVQTN
jgi:hypothetical protein